jgi:hypothetical protein
MQINEAIGVLDNYFGDLQYNDREVAWQVVRDELTKGDLKPSEPNTIREFMPFDVLKNLSVREVHEILQKFSDKIDNIAERLNTIDKHLAASMVALAHAELEELTIYVKEKM